jgi:hypothetical protein
LRLDSFLDKFNYEEGLTSFFDFNSYIDLLCVSFKPHEFLFDRSSDLSDFDVKYSHWNNKLEKVYFTKILKKLVYLIFKSKLELNEKIEFLYLLDKKVRKPLLSSIGIFVIYNLAFGLKDGIDGEGDAESIMEIFKQQQQLRESLQNELNKQGLGGSGQSALDQMKQIEKQLLNKGFNNEVLQRMMNLKYELLKLDKAVQQQGEEEKRQADGAKQQFKNSTPPLPPALQEYLKSIEILNRQTLPLRSNFNLKVQEYFNKND